MSRMLNSFLRFLRDFLHGLWLIAWWCSEGLRRASTRSTGARLLAVGLIVGWLLGWSNGKVIHIVTETELPRPVTPPPPGMVWAKTKTTGYCPCWRCCGWGADGHTSIGRDVREHPFGIAVDSSLISYGTPLLVPGYGYASADDTGGAMRQDGRSGVLHIDLRFRTHEEAQRWGVRWLWLAVPSGAAAARVAEK